MEELLVPEEPLLVPEEPLLCPDASSTSPGSGGLDITFPTLSEDGVGRAAGSWRPR